MVAHQPVNHNGRSLRNKIGIATSLRENSTNPLSSEIKTDAANQSINGSSFGSHHGSNIVHVGNNATLLGRAGNSENDNRKSEKEVTTSGLRFEAPNAAMENQFSQREAALNKFRQKRKERCFEKKVHNSVLSSVLCLVYNLHNKLSQANKKRYSQTLTLIKIKPF